MLLLRKIMGFILLIVVLIGLGTTIYGLILLPRLKTQVEEEVSQNLTLILDALGATQETLTLASTSIDQSAEALETLNQTLDDVSTTLEDTDPLIESIALVMG
nr:hypothetical protein [Gammaproteobacteria bacterium]